MCIRDSPCLDITIPMAEVGSNKRIAKNTLILYARTVLSMIVSFFTVRVVWQVLGVDNYGIFNLVAGIVVMFDFINSAMVQSSQRHISYGIGKGNIQDMQKTFSLTLKIHFLIGLIILLLSETIGVWFINYKLNIPEERLLAANIVFQFSLLAFFQSIISVPYSASIVAHEHIKIYGYYGLINVVLKLLIVYVLLIIPMDKLIAYSLLLVLVSTFMRYLYIRYCKKHFSECKLKNYKDPSETRKMLSFAGWSFIGNMGFSARDQGMNFLLNIFYSVALNAAKGVASNVSGVVMSFTGNFQMALSPQITKRYAQGDITNMLSLVYLGCKYSFFLFMIIAIPLYIAAEYVLTLWLGDVAPYTVGFLHLVLIMAMIDSVISPITTSLQATGRIMLFQILMCITMIISIFIAWGLLVFYDNPYIVMYTSIAASVVALIIRIWLFKRQIGGRILEFIFKVFTPIGLCLSVLFPIGYLLYGLIPETFFNLVVFSTIMLIVSIIVIATIGLSTSERKSIMKLLSKKFKFLKKYA